MEAFGYENIFFLATLTLFICIFLHVVYKKIFKFKKNETKVHVTGKNAGMKIFNLDSISI